jgi:hypothetical protein
MDCEISVDLLNITVVRLDSGAMCPVDVVSITVQVYVSENAYVWGGAYQMNDESAHFL